MISFAGMVKLAGVAAVLFAAIAPHASHAQADDARSF